MKDGVLARDGVQLAYEDAGHGDPPVVLVHGWTCDRSALLPQREHLLAHHRVVSVDLRGHGASDKPRQDYTMEVFADDVAALLRHLGIDRPAVIGHSMGGVVALVLAARHPGRPGAIVTLDAPVVPSDAMRRATAALVPALEGPGYRQAQQAFVRRALLQPGDDPARAEVLIAAMASAPQHVMVSAFREMLACDTAAAAAACRVPFLYLYAAKPATDLKRLRDLCPHVITGQTVGAGHFHQLEVPEQVNAMIDRFLGLIAAKVATA
jgi:pimeloyl-ACP methyl ester carboxylesterase